MDYVGSEISHKIRSAIKAKLMELGAYVDEELPEYIMVMVANKRAKAQMDGDLQLFLGNNTSLFTSWLYQVLQKLQEVTVGNLDKKSTKTTSSSTVIDASTNKRKITINSETDTHRKEKRRKSSETRKAKRTELEKPRESKKDLDNGGRSHSRSSDTDKCLRPHVNKESVSSSRSETSDSVVSSSADGRLSRKLSVREKERIEKLQESDIAKRNITKSTLSNGSSRVDEKNYISRLRAEALRSRDERAAALKLGEASEVMRHLPNKQQKETKPASSKIVYSQPLRTKIVLMNSDDEDDDEDFINIKADAEAEQLLKEELPRDAMDTSVSTPELGSVPAELSGNPKKSPEGPALPPELPTIPLNENLVSKRQIVKQMDSSSDQNPTSMPVLSATPDLPVAPAQGRLLRKRAADTGPPSAEAKLMAKEEVKPTAGVPSIKDRLGVKKLSPAQLVRRNEASKAVARIAMKSAVGETETVLQVEATATPVETSNGAQTSSGNSVMSRVVTVRPGHRSSRLLRGQAQAVTAAATAEDEEYDPSNPGVGSVASVVHVKPRPKLPAALQANKALILKAVAEAQKSVASAPARTEPTRSTGLWKRTGSGFVRKRENNVAVTVPNQLCTFDDTEEVLEADVKPDSTRFVSTTESDNKLVIKVSSNSQPRSSQVNQDFGADSSQDVTRSQGEPASEDEGLLLQFHDDDEGLGLEETDTHNSGGVRSVVYPPVGLASRMPRERNNNQPSQQHPSSSPQFLVTLDGLDPDLFGARTAALDDQAALKDDDDMDTGDAEPSQKKNKTPIVFKLDSVDDSSEPSALPKSLERCKYWPSCRLGATCNFHHPVTPCKSFPKCPFGEKCLYVHPFCKFNSACTRRDCTFVHASPRTLMSPTGPRPIAVAKQTYTSPVLCRFFPKCNNTSCRFLHPKTCRYGKFCSKQDCNFIHQEIPSVDKLRWTSPFKT